MPASPVKKLALLIGINQYQFLPELKYARQDAEAVADALKKNYCFSDEEIILMTDAQTEFKPTNWQLIKHVLDQLSKQEFDLFIFGFWGYSAIRGGQRYFCLLDATDDKLNFFGFSSRGLQKMLINIKAKNTCVILDCCHNIQGLEQAASFTAEDKKVLESSIRLIASKRRRQFPNADSNIVVCNSCNEGQYSNVWDVHKHSRFTQCLLDALNHRYDCFTKIINSIANQIEAVSLVQGNKQNLFCRRKGDIVLPVNPDTDKTTPFAPGDVFISYRRENSDFVTPIEEELKRQGISYFIYREGDKFEIEYNDAISKAINECKVFLVVWTENSNDSPDMVRELAIAQELKKTIIPYRVGDFNPESHQNLYSQLSSLNLYEYPEQTPEIVAELVNRIKQVLTGSRNEPIAPPKIQSAAPSENNKKNKKKSRRIFKFDNWQYNLILLLSLIISAFLVVFTIKRVIPSGVERDYYDTDSYEEQVEPEEDDGFLISTDSPQPKTPFSPEGRKAGDREVATVNGVEFAFRWCPPGTFTMGSPESEEGRYDEEIQHQVTLTKGFWIMETEVTQNQWKAVTGEYRSNFKGDDLPVECVSWNDCQEFCRRTGLQLPTEAQWEYACRAGNTGAYAGNLDEMGWYKSNSGGHTHPVGTRKPNAWGLYDMHGNVWEWCREWKAAYPSGNVTDPSGPSGGSYRVGRGGGWRENARDCRSAPRGGFRHYNRISILGFRCIISDPGLLASIATTTTSESSAEAPKEEHKAGDRDVVTVNGVEFAFRWCPPGTFMMGSPESEGGRQDDETQHQVTLTKGFWILETEVTQKQWQAVMGNNPSHFKGDNNPVENVSWNDCQDFCRKTGFQLPTEVQWEYACRAETTDAFAGNLDEMAWYGHNSRGRTYPVGSKKNNAWGLYDMHGNVWEWCQDSFRDYPKDNVTDPIGVSDGSNRIIRGGSWADANAGCRSADRNFTVATDRNFAFGFRIVRNQ